MLFIYFHMKCTKKKYFASKFNSLKICECDHDSSTSAYTLNSEWFLAKIECWERLQ